MSNFVVFGFHQWWRGLGSFNSFIKDPARRFCCGFHCMVSLHGFIKAAVGGAIEGAAGWQKRA